MALLAEIYSEHKAEFIVWIKKTYPCDEHAAQDIFQASMLSMYENIMTGRLTSFSSSPKTYLFAVGKNKARELQRRSSKEIKHIELYSFSEETTEEEEWEEQEKKINMLSSALKSLGDPCKKLLNLFYFHKQGLEEITKNMGYKNPGTTKNLKYKCIVRLRKIYKVNG